MNTTHSFWVENQSGTSWQIGLDVGPTTIWRPGPINHRREVVKTGLFARLATVYAIWKALRSC